MAYSCSLLSYVFAHHLSRELTLDQSNSTKLTVVLNLYTVL